MVGFGSKNNWMELLEKTEYTKKQLDIIGKFKRIADNKYGVKVLLPF
ncbi:MAG TPA: hypothetical protein VGR56_04130 [Nitrososphaerales archaeon]|nr:hypothetical protein [Nitrososphaerales archaeon]